MKAFSTHFISPGLSDVPLATIYLHSHSSDEQTKVQPGKPQQTSVLSDVSSFLSCLVLHIPSDGG